MNETFNRTPENEIIEKPESNNMDFTQKCLKEIEFQGENMPHLEINQNSANRFEYILNSCENAYGTPIVCVVRCFNKSKKDLNNFFTRFEKIKKFIPEIQGVIISINQEGDKDGQTSKNLDEILNENDGRKDAVPLPVKNYSWTAGLNGPTALLYQRAKEKNLNPENMSIFNISFDVDFDDGALMDFAKQYRANKIVMTIRKEKEQLKNNEQQKIANWETLKNILRANLSKYDRELPGIIGNDNLMALARNTATCFRLSQIKEIGGYDKSCNNMGGMEDHDFTIRTLLDAFQNKNHQEAKKMIDILKKPIEYNDSAWNDLSTEKQNEKLLREQKATETIIKKITSLKKTDDIDKYKTLKENQDFRF